MYRRSWRLFAFCIFVPVVICVDLPLRVLCLNNIYHLIYVYYMYIILNMNIVWDPDKARMNIKKHGIRFSDAEIVLFDPNALTSEDMDVNHEQRFVTVGTDAIGHVLVVVYTYRGEDIRLISARPATKREREKYEKGI